MIITYKLCPILDYFVIIDVKDYTDTYIMKVIMLVFPHAGKCQLVLVSARQAIEESITHKGHSQAQIHMLILLYSGICYVILVYN